MDENFPIKKPNIRTLALVVATLLYLLTGAVVFDQLESKTEEMNKDRLRNQILTFRTSVNMSDFEFERLYKHMVKKSHHRNDIQWNFLGSFYFCTLALALVGYGHTTPATSTGKLFAIFYTIFGKCQSCLRVICKLVAFIKFLLHSLIYLL